MPTDDLKLPPIGIMRRLPGIAVGIVLAIIASVTVAAAQESSLDGSFGASSNIWIERDVLRSLPTSGRAWDNLADDATGSWGGADVGDNTSKHDTLTFAGALYAVRQNDTGMRERVVDAIESAVGTETSGNALSLSRNLTGYVLAADIIGYRSDRFASWVDSMRSTDREGRTLISTHEDRPNNWGTHAGAARMVADLYLGDRADLERARDVFLGWLGDRTRYDDFSFGDLEWQADERNPVAVNPAGATKDGHFVDGALPDDIRRCECSVTSSPPKENYQWEAMQGVLAQATILSNQGYTDVWTASDSAVRRAVSFLYDHSDFPAEGDDRFLPYLIDAGLGTSYADGVEAQTGKSIGYTDWTHAAGVEAVPTPTTPTTAPPTTQAPTTTAPPTTQAPTTTTAPPTTTPPTTAPPTTQAPTTTTPPTTTTTAPPSSATPEADPGDGLWIDPSVLRTLPTSGKAWEAIVEEAEANWGRADISDNGSDHDVSTLAGALYAARTGDAAMRSKVVAAIEDAVGTERGGSTLGLGRNLTGYVLAADIIGHHSDRFTSWLSDVRFTSLKGRTLVSTHEDRPNAWGTHAGAARIAADIYLDDTSDLADARRVFLGYLGDRDSYTGFKFGRTSWAADAKDPVPINPVDSTRDGYVVDGAIVDAIRVCGCRASDTPPTMNAQWEAMQGLVTQATLLTRAGYRDAWTASDGALRRAVSFLYDRSDFPAEGDDRFLTFLIDRGLRTTLSDGVTSQSGKSVGFTDWTHAT